jgi:hypothetical protein
MRITNVERASRPVHRSVGPGDPTYGREKVSQIGRAWRPDLRGEKRCHRLVGPGDPTYGARKGVTDRSGLETRPTGREKVSQIGRAWRPDLRARKGVTDRSGLETRPTRREKVSVRTLSWGLPRGRRVDWRFRCRAIACTQVSSPKGEPRWTLLRTALSSAAVSGLLTPAVQRGKRAIGEAEIRRGSRSGSSSHRLSEPHLQSSARLTSPARKALCSTHRQTSRKCSSSWTGKLLKRP